MERIEEAAHYFSGNIIMPTLVKEEPESDYETNEENTNNILDCQVMKAEPKNCSDDSDAAMHHSDEDEGLKVKLEAGDPEKDGRGVDGGLRGRLKEEETSPDPNGNLNNFFFLFFLFYFFSWKSLKAIFFCFFVLFLCYDTKSIFF